MSEGGLHRPRSWPPHIMIDTRPKPLLAALLLGALLLGAAAPLRAQVAPFQPGLRWLDGAELLTPWIPTSVGFAAGSELVWVGAKYGQPRLLLCARGVWI